MAAAEQPLSAWSSWLVRYPFAFNPTIEIRIKQHPMWLFNRRKRARRAERLKQDFEKVHELCERSSKISYDIISRDGRWPDQYLVNYQVKSIIGINPNQEPVYGYRHSALIRLPASYPLHQPSCYMKTSLWHPNIRYSGKLKGHICINENKLGAWHTLDMLIIRIGRMLQYKNYHALNKEPWPEDAEVAKWVRDFAEPQNIVNKFRKIYTEDEPLHDPTWEWTQSREMPDEDPAPPPPKPTIQIRPVPNPSRQSQPDTEPQKPREEWPSFLKKDKKSPPKIWIRPRQDRR